MTDITIDQPLHLEFELDIDNNKTLPEVSLNIPVDDNINFRFNGYVEGKIATITIPNLEKYSDLIEKKVLEGRLEVIADNRVFYPWKDTFSIIKEVKVSAAVKVEKAIKAKPMRVNLKKVEEIDKNKIGTIIILDKDCIIEGTEYKENSKIEVLDSMQEGYIPITKTTDINDFRLEKGDYVKWIK